MDESAEEHILKGEAFSRAQKFDEAMAAFEEAIAIDRTSERAHVGKVMTLSKEGRFMQAFAACRAGLTALPDNKTLLAMRQDVTEAYKRDKEAKKEESERKVEETRAHLEKAGFFGKAPGAPKEVAEAGCPSSRAGEDVMPEVQEAMKKWKGKNPSEKERRETKAMLMSTFRELYAKTGTSSSSTSTLTSTATSEYSENDKLGLVIQGGHRPLPRPKDVSLPENYKKSLGVISPAELSKHSCNSDRLLISVYGDIFDVSDRADKYGKDGPYSYFAGCDITWGLVSGKDDELNVNKFYDIWKISPQESRDQKLQCVCSWLGFYEKEYGAPIGRLDIWDNERNLPAPPSEEMEACTVM